MEMIKLNAYLDGLWNLEDIEALGIEDDRHN